MRTHMLARWPLVAGLALVVGACTESLSSVNKNRNSPLDADARFLLPEAIRSSLDDTRMQLAHTSIWSQHTVQIQYADEETGLVRPGTIQDFWDTYYANSLKDIQVVIEKSQSTGWSNGEAVGRIWKAWLFHQITDLWGDVPYTEALTLTPTSGTATPAYDTQQAIYAALIQSLKDAEVLLNPADSGFQSGDILYGNDVEKWRRFSVSLRMRLAMRLSEVAPATAQTEFVSAYNAGGFQSNADNAILEWPGAPYRQPLFENWQTRDDDGISQTMVDTLKALNDPRLPLYAEPADSPAAPVTYSGLGNNIYTPPLSLVWYSRIGNFWREDGAETPTAIMTYSEVLFLEAEAAERGWILTPADATTLYEAAIRANMNQWDPWAPANAPTDSAINAYVLQPAVVYVPGAPGLAQIQLQKWISLFMQGNEAFANQRRTDMPSLVLGPDISFRPVRFYYPEGEQSLNGVNMQAAVTRQMPQGDARTLQGRVWWDVVTPP